MKSDSRTEVLVVGAGPVGMLTALVLGENGVQTEIIDQEWRPATHSHACALHPLPLKLLDQAGIMVDAVDLGWIVDSIGIYEGKERRGQLSLSELSVDFPFVLVLPQSKLEEFLERRLKELPNVHFGWNRRLQDLLPDNDGVSATIDQLSTTAKGYVVPRMELGVEKQLHLRADFVVGADGHNSVVRRRLGIEARKAGGPDLFTVYEFETNERQGHEMKLIFTNGMGSVMWPLSGNRCRWSFQIAPTATVREFPEKDRTNMIVEEPESPTDQLHQLQRLLKERAPWFSDAVKELKWTTEIQFEHWVAGEFGRGRCWLAGDAAHQTGPIGMQSVNMGLSEGVDLARLLVRILRQGSSPGLLKSYELHHRGQWEKLLGLSGRLTPHPNAPAWACENRERILGSLPASGQDLELLLARLKLQLN